MLYSSLISWLIFERYGSNDHIIFFRSRWIRVLFGREFPLQDLLMVWDAIFSDIQPTFPLVDFLTVAMLSFIREPRKLSADLSSAQQLLV